LQLTLQLPLGQQGEQLHKIHAKKANPKISSRLMVKIVTCDAPFQLDKVFDLIVTQYYLLLQLATLFECE